MIASLVIAAALWPPPVTDYCKKMHNDEPANILVIGVAKNLQGDFLYCEIVRQRDEYNVNIEYTRTDKTFATKNINYASSTFAPEITQYDMRSGERREANADSNHIYLKYQPSKNKKMLQTKIAKIDIDIIDAGFDSFVREHWEDLNEGKILSINFGSIVHQKVLPLRVSKKPREKCSLKTKDENLTCYRVDVDNALLRIVLENIKIVYDEHRRLHQFSGIVNLQDDDQNNQAATINYFYNKDYEKLENN